MSIKTIFALSGVAVGSVLCVSIAVAQENTTTVSRTYTVTPKAGMAAQFETALRDHAQWRAANGDPWPWRVSMVETGDDIGSFYIRSGGHSWADFDAYDAGFGPQGLLHWNANVAPLVESITSEIKTVNQALSKPPPASAGPVSFVTYNRFYLRPGREAEFMQLAGQATEIVRDKLSGYWVWVSSISGGGPGPYIDLVSFFESWADMAEPDPTFEAIMMQEMGEEAFAKWGAELGQTLRGTEVFTRRLRPDMDVN